MMELEARLFLAGIFALAGIAKLRDRAGARQALVDFGVPEPLAHSLGVALPIGELVVALALIPAATSIYGAVGALALLLIFMAAMAVNIAYGRRPNCQCFGQVRSAPIGWKSLTRNTLLAAVATLIIYAGWTNPASEVADWVALLTPFERVAVLGGGVGLILLAVQNARLLTLAAQNERVLARLAGPVTEAPQPGTATETAPPAVAPGSGVPAVAPRVLGAPAPDFALPSLDGGTVTLEALRAPGLPIILFFSDPGCGLCQSLLPEIGRWQRDESASLTVAVISRGTPEGNRGKADEHKLTRVLLQRDREISAAYGVMGTPSAILLRPDGTFGSGMAQAEASIRNLHHLAQSLRPAVVPEGPPPVEALPLVERPLPPEDFTLPDLDGRPVSLSQFKGKPTLILFWNPACGFCQTMLGELKRWELRPASTRPQLLVVSSGDVEDTRVQGLLSTVLVDSKPTMGVGYDALGTPSAVLVDEDGRPLHSAVIGVPNVRLALDGIWPGTVLPAGATPVQSEGVEDELLHDGSLVLYHTDRNQVLTLNGTAAMVWECCDGDHSVAAIIKEVRDMFADAPDPEPAVRQLLDKLLLEGMLAMPAPPSMTA